MAMGPTMEKPSSMRTIWAAPRNPIWVEGNSQNQVAM